MESTKSQLLKNLLFPDKSVPINNDSLKSAIRSGLAYIVYIVACYETYIIADTYNRFKLIIASLVY